MTKNIYAVIGANYGDEGKGQTVSYLCQQHTGNKIVVLTNGSSQRGHTAVIGNKKHIFHHFGSGLLADADNFFSKDFIVNPFMFENEEKELQEKKITLTRCFVHKDAKMAFVYDMFVNQIIELSRTNKHGSCGCGVWETLKRYETVCNKTVSELYHLNNTELEDYIKFCALVSLSRAEELIKEENLPTNILNEYSHLFTDEDMLESVIDSINHFFNVVKIVDDCSFLHNYETVVFENGQGLLLDRRIDKKLSTPSITGCETLLTTINDGFNIKDIKPKLYYITRTYITRHGSVDFKEKCDMSEINPNMFDETNQPNPYQGTLMYGKLNFNELYERVENDVQRLGIPVEYGLSVTHTSDYPWGDKKKPIGDLWLEFKEGNTMAKICPITNKKVVYLKCLECDEKVCEETQIKKHYNFNAKETKDKLVQWIRDWFEVNGKGCNAVIGLSGGKDSNVVAALCVEALGKDRVIGVTIPNIVQTEAEILNEDLKDVNTLVDHLGIRLIQLPLSVVYCNIIANLESQLGGYENVTEQTRINLSPRLRMSMLYAVSQSVNGRVANTCNWSEEYVGYSTRYGDGGTGDFSPLGNLTVTEILEIGKYLNIPYYLVDKKPADGLCGKTDEDNLGFTYETLDKYIRDGICEDENVKNLIDVKHNKNLFKLQPIPTFKI